jgi:hypothetical protein
MCFSASTSFISAAATCVVGIVALTRVNEARELPLAATPLLFSIQQSIEGLLWLKLPLGSDILTLLYLVFAEVFWPLYAAIAVWLVERSQRHRHLMAACLFSASVVGVYLLWFVLGRPYSATIADGHIAYTPTPRPAKISGLAYVAVASLPFLLSTQRTVFIFGVIILVGLVVSRTFYLQTFISVWCFFAAAASVTLLLYFFQKKAHIRDRMWPQSFGRLLKRDQIRTANQPEDSQEARPHCAPVATRPR